MVNIIECPNGNHNVFDCFCYRVGKYYYYIFIHCAVINQYFDMNFEVRDSRFAIDLKTF
jgi:hypothetical protein